MNDRLRFRVWVKTANSYISEKDEADIVRLEEDGKIVVGLYDGDLEDMIYLKEQNLIIEQCTGLKDKNGRLIYEGDIVKFKISSIKCVGAVRWDERTGGWLKDKTGQPLHTYIKSVEVIGNIHENTQLLGDE